MSQHYRDPKRANDPYSLPDVETFRAFSGDCPFCTSGVTVHAAGETIYCDNCSAGRKGFELRSDQLTEGWFYWSCFPGCLPESDPIGPFDTEDEAIADARDGIEDDEDDHEDDTMATCADCGDEYLAWQGDQHVCRAQEPDEDSLTTDDHERFYQYGRLVLEATIRRDGEVSHEWFMYDSGRQSRLGKYDTCEAALRAYMDRVQFWPDVYFISDHGNAHRIDLSERQ